MSAEPERIDARALEAYGLHGLTSEGLVDALRLVLAERPATIYPHADEELSEAERDVIAGAGIGPDALSGLPEAADPLARGTARFAALIASALSPTDVAERLGVQHGKVRQMIARRTLYSVKLDERRHVPIFQFRADGPLVRNIGRVNAALPPTLHPVRVAGWYSTPDADLALDDERGPAMTPLRWLDSGGDPARLVSIAAGL